MNKHSQKLEQPAAPKPEPKQPVVLPSLQFTVAHFTRHEVELLRKVCRDSDYEDAGKVLAGAIKRGDGR